MRLSNCPDSLFFFHVSIHASVKDATLPIDIDLGDLVVSIHASVKDATFLNGTGNVQIEVSIHASVKDATLVPYANVMMDNSFNPRICKRCDSMFVKSFIDDTFKL